MFRMKIKPATIRQVFRHLPRFLQGGTSCFFITPLQAYNNYFRCPY